VKRLGLALALLGAAAGCLDVAEERAQREERIGQAEGDGVSVQIDDGLGAVRSLDRSSLRLWASAPAFTIRIAFTPPVMGRFTLAIDNGMPDAVLTGAAEVLVGQSAVPTERHWSFTPPAVGGSLVLTVAPSDAATPGPFRFVAMADVQEAIGRVQEVFQRINREPEIRFVIFNGDLTQWGSVEELSRFQREVQTLLMPIFATLGNHELGDSVPPYHALFGRGSFRFPFRGVQFTLLDSASATIAPLTYDRLGRWLAEAQARMHIVGMHIPPIDPVGTRNGSFASRPEAARVLAMLAGGGVDLTLYGHLHSYYSFWNAGIPAFVSGGGGAIPERFDGIGRHFLTIDVDPARSTADTRVVRVD
jgi:predicted phosphodiesterase